MSAAFIFQALHGTLCLYIEDVSTAFRLARLRTQSPLSREPIPLWARHDVVMWPHALGHSADLAWKTISTLPERCLGFPVSLAICAITRPHWLLITSR